jgi:hypothetical protein
LFNTTGDKTMRDNIAIDQRKRGRRTVEARKGRRLRPTLLALEGRELLSTTWTVNSLGDTGTGSGSLGDLRYCINAADTTPGANIINVSVTGMITLSGTQLELNNTSRDPQTIEISGPGANLLTISGNKASRVFQVDKGVTASISGLTITGGELVGSDVGGGILNDGGTVTLTDCTVSGNYSGGYGGGLHNDVGGAATLTDCTLSDNSSLSFGGGLSNGGTATLTDCTLSGNFASGSGGGLDNSGTATLTNCTVTGNSASGSGGGLDNGGTVSLTNTIVAGNTQSDIFDNQLGTVSGAYNLIGTENTEVLSNTDGNQVGVANPGLDPKGLQSNGGPTQTIALVPGSPAIGTGNPSRPTDPSTNQPVTADQRGYQLPPKGTPQDIGAFQDQGFAVAVSSGYNQSTAVNTAFANPLAVTVTANNTGQFTNPVDGGVIGFTVNPATNGASASLSAATATISNGQASVTATANTIVGSYSVTTSAAGASSASFSLTNDAATPSITTTQLQTTAVVGTAIADTATVTGGYNPTGTVTFNLYNNPNGTGTPLFTDPNEPLSGGTATSKGYTTTATGTDYWVATYNGDNNNNSVTSTANAEPVSITPATPSITTTQVQTTAVVGTAIADTATVTGGYNPTGTVTFNLYNNNNASGTPLFTDTETLVGGVATSKGTTQAAGTDYWVATYNGDSNNNSVTSGLAAEPVTVTPANTMTTLTSSANPAVPGQAVTFTAIIAAVAPGGGTPTGSVTFTSNGTTLSGVTYSVVGGQLQASVTTSYVSSCSPVITASYNNSDGNYKGSSNSLTQTVLAPGVYVSGTTLYIIGGSTSSDTASVKPAGSKNDGSTGLTVNATLNNVSSSKTFTQTFTAIVVAGYAGNETFTLASTLALPTTVTAGNGNDVIQLGAGNSTVTLGNGNDQVNAGNGNNSITVGTGNDTIVAGNGSNTITAGAAGSMGTDSIMVGNGNNDSVSVSGNGNDQITIGNGYGDSVTMVGNGSDTITTGTGSGTVHVAGTGQYKVTLGSKGWRRV